MIKHFAAVLAILLAAPVAADPPRVVADIAPVHSLVAQVMDGVGAPELVLPPGASPHSFSMKPSQAAALAQADLVIWVGPALTPWLDRALGGRETLALEDVEGLTRLPFRDGEAFGAHEHHRGGDDYHAAHTDDDDRDGHGHGHGHDDHHQDGAEVDPHLWLDPDNATRWLDVIAAALAAADPENALAYTANAAAAKAALTAQAEAIATRSAALGGGVFVARHDATHYFEHRFGVEAAGALSDSNDGAAGLARVRKLTALLGEAPNACVFGEAGRGDDLVLRVAEASGARLAELDPVGARLTPGAGFYGALIGALADDLFGCLETARHP